MNNNKYYVAFGLLFFALNCNAGSQRPAGSRDVPPDDPVSQGGRLYDKWWAEMGLPKPQITHPAYPVAGKKKGADTWRCKECHGWDYRGKDGQYGKGSHFTGIKGIRTYDGGDAKAALKILTDSNHQYQRVLPPQALELLAVFAVKGQIDMDKYIDRQSGEIIVADLNRGRMLFNENCARCHDEDGRYQNFSGNPAEPEYVGTVGSENPWEAWNKIRNGQPGSVMPMGPGMMGRWRHNEAMPTFRSFSVEDQLAILGYIRTLPEN